MRFNDLNGLNDLNLGLSGQLSQNPPSDRLGIGDAYLSRRDIDGPAGNG